MSARATGLLTRRGYMLDARTILAGAVRAGARGQTAETRTGAARLLTTDVSEQDVFKAILFGQDVSSAGGYSIQVAHVAQGAALGTATGWVPIGVLSQAGIGQTELALSGLAIENAVRASAALAAGAEVRAVAVRAKAGSGDLAITNVVLTSNVATLTVASHPFVVGDVIFVQGCSNTVFNGTYTVTAQTGTTISYARTNANIGTVAGTGTITNGVGVPAGTQTLVLHPGDIM